MGSTKHVHVLLYFILLFFSFVACGPSPRQRLAATLADVESYINDRPDSALAVLESVDSSALTSRALRARYSLLRTMAQAKNYRDLTVPGLIDDAAVWYEHHGSPDEKMKTLYYQGCIAQANKDQNNAAIFYSRAEQLAEKASDKHAVGLLFEAMASVYNTVYNTAKEQEYAEKALATFSEANDPIYGSALGVLAFVYHSRKDWSKADSLYQRAIDNSESYPHALSLYLSNYARMKVLQPDKDPGGTLELLSKKRELSGGGLTPQEAGAYAYAAVLLGKDEMAEALIQQLMTLSERYSSDVLPWLSRICLARGEYETAYHYQTASHIQETVAIQEALSDSITQALKEEADQRAEAAHLRLQKVLLLASAVCLALLSIVLLGIIHRRKLKEERDRLVCIREQLQQELESSENKRNGQYDQLLEMEQKIAREREIYTRERVSRLRQLGELRSTFWWRERVGIKEAEALRRIKEEISYVFQTDNNGVILVRRLDTELDGAISRLRKELHLRGKPREVLFICCCILDLEPELIAEIIGTSKANVYEKRSRLRARIRDLGDPLLSVLVEKL